MSSRDLFRAIGQIDDDLIESANKTPVKHTIPLQFRHFVPAAACFCLVLLGAAMVSQDRSAGVSQAAETADLIAHIIERYHKVHRREFPAVIALATAMICSLPSGCGTAGTCGMNCRS